MSFINRIFKLLLLILLFALCIVIVTQNRTTVEFSVSPLLTLHSVPVYLLVFAAFAGGFVLSTVLQGWENLRHRFRIFFLERKVRKLESKATQSTEITNSTPVFKK